MMVFVERILACCIMLVCIIPGLGLQFSLTQIPEDEYCGHLRCVADPSPNDQLVFSIVGIAIYDITQASNKEKVASVSVSSSASDLYLEPGEYDFMKVSGNVTRYHADLNLDIKKTVTCENRTYLCEFDFLNLSGQLDSQQKRLAPKSSNCSVSNCELSGTFDDLNGRADKIKEELDRLSHSYDDLESNLNDYLAGHHQTAPTNKPGTTEPVTTRPETSGPETTEPPPVTVSSCTKGMSHNNPRETITLNDNKQTLCDTETDGGGWIVIQRRAKGDVDFYKDWDDYKKGFGAPTTDFWLGNDVIHGLTSQGYTELRVDLEHGGNKVFAHYSSLTVGDENSNYKLTVTGYSGTAGDSLSYHSGMSFTTFDRDHDQEVYYNCGEYFHGAWWYKDCFESNLNGEWGKDGGSAISWNQFLPGKALSFSEIKIRHV